ncbi:Regulation of nuclear pre-mRNA domain-containing protein 1B-like protein [Leptotrombidium deliense]|uniref:Regulation of nuclear pre-mRNA domain-containing protein 1B-like protein n=1 Tax=Leptotrombidium deliense TaxID=299467 RepID=A0A443SPB9_9ACAR|nr:Regulation of nuclear pre-mRNA domain-containing protein 1B-like protein [Leptotrombidium deliense]
MSGFTSEALQKRLSELNSSQQSIQTLSLWLIHHRKHHAAIVQTWFKELKKARQNRKLTFMYLANDVIQNSRKKGPEFTKEFGLFLKAAFENVAKEADDKTWVGLDRVLSVWCERNIYDEFQVAEFRKAIGTKKGPETNKNGKSYSQKNLKSNVEIKYKREKQKSHKNSPDLKKKKIATSASNHCNTVNVNASVSNKVTVTDKSVNGDSVIDTDNLIKSLQQLENSASSDAMIREKIASFPPEVSDSTLLEKIQDKDAAEKLSKQVEEACILLVDYNTRLTQELEDRKQISLLLTSFLKHQKSCLESDEQKLLEYKEKLRKITQVRTELKSHLQNLPDLSLLPSVTGGLAPLPSAGDLFSVAAARAAANISSSTSTSPNTASPADYETVIASALNS